MHLDSRTGVISTVASTACCVAELFHPPVAIAMLFFLSSCSNGGTFQNNYLCSSHQRLYISCILQAWCYLSCYFCGVLLCYEVKHGQSFIRYQHKHSYVICSCSFLLAMEVLKMSTLLFLSLCLVLTQSSPHLLGCISMLQNKQLPTLALIIQSIYSDLLTVI